MIRLLYERLIKLKLHNIIVTFVNTSLLISYENLSKTTAFRPTRRYWDKGVQSLRFDLPELAVLGSFPGSVVRLRPERLRRRLGPHGLIIFASHMFESIEYFSFSQTIKL